jgi:protein-tyrosine phosphatase
MAHELVDIHCHILPDIDDGPDDWDASLAMARMAVADGIATVIATPHQLGRHSANDGEQIRRLVAALNQRLAAERIPLRVLPGGDVRIEADMVQKVVRGEVVSLADRRRHVLLELPHDLFFPLGRLIEELSAKHMIGILSHPERNRAIQREPALVPPLVAAGCLMQVTAGSLLGEFGERSQQISEWLLERNLVHFVASDGHNTSSRKPELSAARLRVAELAGEELAERLCAVNPSQVAEGKKVPPLPERPRRRRLAGWLGRS